MIPVVGPLEAIVSLHDAFWKWGYDVGCNASPLQKWEDGASAMLQAGAMAGASAGPALGMLGKEAGALAEGVEGVEGGVAGGGGGEPLVDLHHGSVDNYGNILKSGLDVDRGGAAYVSPERAAAQDAINYRTNNFPHQVTDPGIVTSRVPQSQLQALVNSGEIGVRPYNGFFPYPLNTTEYQLFSPAAKELFNSGIVR